MFKRELTTYTEGQGDRERTPPYGVGVNEGRLTLIIVRKLICKTHTCMHKFCKELRMNRTTERITCCSHVLWVWVTEATWRQGLPSHACRFKATRRHLHHQQLFFSYLSFIARLQGWAKIIKEDKRIAWGICAKSMHFEERKKRHKVDPGHADIQDGCSQVIGCFDVHD